MFTTRVISVSIIAALFLVGQAHAANNIPRAALIATDPGMVIPQDIYYLILTSYVVVAACNPPNNGDHKVGSSCKFFSGPSDSSPVISGSK